MKLTVLENETLITVLRQLRAGHPLRPRGFPQSLALIGVRDVRDYKVASGGSSHLGIASPFNIKLRSFTLSNFSYSDVTTLYQQHTDLTGQEFMPKAAAYAYGLSQEQPWLVNSLAKVVVEELVPNSEETITVDHMATAQEILIQRRETHLDSLMGLL
jgi:hypothetical protein